MLNHGREITAMIISPNRDLAEQFSRSVARLKSFQIVSDLKAYPAQQTLDMRLRQLRPDVVLVDLSTDLDAACDLIRYTSTQTPPIQVVGLHLKNDSDAILRSLRVGASEFLHAPFDPAAQEAAVNRLQRLAQPDPSTERELGKLVVFSSTKPGSGASTLAAQTAFALQRTTGKRVLLADFDLMGGTLAFYLKLDQTHSVVDALENAERMDARLWASMTVNAGLIEVLPAPEMPYAEPIDPGRLHDVLQYARMMYDWVIVDLPAIFNRVSLLALSHSDRAFLVSTSELASLHLARRAIKLLNHLGFDATRFQMIINRLDKRDGLSGSDLSKLFGSPIDISLPNDYFSLHRVVTLGEALDGDTELGKAVEELASKLCGSTRRDGKTPSHFASTRPALSQI
ncbi:MAG: AAA family ATPase [Bryobacteraceae bacterium]